MPKPASHNEQPPAGRALCGAALPLHNSHIDCACAYWQSIIIAAVGQQQRGPKRQKAYRELGGKIGIAADVLRDEIACFRARCRYYGIDPYHGGPYEKRLRPHSKHVGICEYCKEAFIYYQDKLRFCSRDCRLKWRADAMARCRYLVDRGWGQKAIQRIVRIKSETIGMVMRAAGRRKGDGQRKWDLEMCRMVQGEINEAKGEAGGTRRQINQALADKYGISLRAFESRMARYRKRMRREGQNPHPNAKRAEAIIIAPAPPRPRLVWDDAQCAEALHQIEMRWDPRKPPSQQTNCCVPVAEMYGITRSALVARIRRYKIRMGMIDV